MDRITCAISRYTRYTTNTKRGLGMQPTSVLRIHAYSERTREHHHSLRACTYLCAIVHRCAWQMQRPSRNVESLRVAEHTHVLGSSPRGSTVARIADKFRLRKITFCCYLNEARTHSRSRIAILQDITHRLFSLMWECTIREIGNAI